MTSVGDCGLTIQNKTPEMNLKLQGLAQRLNIKKHTVKTVRARKWHASSFIFNWPLFSSPTQLHGSMSTELYTCFDLEGHQGKDGR